MDNHNMSDLIIVPFLNEDLFQNVLKKIDPECKLTKDVLQIKFPEKFIEISDLKVLTKTSCETLKKLVVDGEKDKIQLLSPFLEDKIYNDFLTLKPGDLHANKTINDLIDYHLEIKKCYYFIFIKLANNDFEYLNRLPRILYFFEEYGLEEGTGY